MKSTLHPQTHQFLFSKDGYVAEMCIEEESLALAYHLRYRSYLEAGAIKPNPEEIFIDDYDAQKNVCAYLIWYEGRPVASVRSLAWSADYDWLPTSCIRLFEEDVDKHLGLQTPIMESNRYVVDPDFQGRKSLTAQILLFRILAMSAIAGRCAYVITAVRPKHARFYARFMDFYPISEPISVPMVSFKIQLLATPVASREKLVESSPIAAYEEADLKNYLTCLKMWNAK